MTSTRRFAHAPESVAGARRFAAEVLRRIPEELRDTIVLMVSELASNCIRHTHTGFELTIIQDASEIRVEATDRGGGTPTKRDPGLSDPDGRGLQIVDMLASGWGFDPVEEGKMVWFTVPSEAPLRIESCSA